MEENKFKVGNKVKLITGEGPIMVVHAIGSATTTQGDAKVYTCLWWSESEQKFAKNQIDFYASDLELS